MNFFWSEFRGVEDNIPKPREAPWETFIAEKMQFQVANSKDAVGLWNPVKFKPESKRNNSGAEALSALVYDLDDKTDEFMSQLRASLAGIEHIFHTSFSHLLPGKANRFRIILPLSRPATRKEWRATRLSFAHAHGFLGDDDRKADSECTFFYWPTHSPDAPHLIEHVKGRLVDVETSTSVERPKESRTAPDGANGPLIGKLGHHDNFIQRWSKSPPGSDAFLWYEKFRSCQPIAAFGGRDDALQKAMWAVVNRMTNEQIHDVDENLIVNFMAKSIEATPGPEDDRISADDVRSKLRRARRDVLTERAGQLTEKKDSEEFLNALFKKTHAAPEIARATDVKPVPPSELWTDLEKENFSRDFFGRTPIKPVILLDRHFVVFTRNGFSQRLMNEYVGSFGVRESLGSSGIEPLGIKRGEVFIRSGKDILDKYPAMTDIAREVRGSFVGTSHYNSETKTFTEVVNPIRQVEPVQDLEIDKFLRAYCAKPRDYDHLLAWLKRFPNLNLPNNVLFVYGPKNIGKSLISIALSRFWNRESGIDPFNYFESFQDAFIRCPFVVADEGLPKDMVNSNEIRKFATTGEHMVNRKHMPAVPWSGYARMVINANNVDELKFSKDVLNQESIEAIEARFLRIQVSEKIREFIQERGGRAWTETLVAGDRFIKHVQWLAQYHEHPQLSTDARFPAMTDPDDRMHDSARLDQSLSEPVCAVIWRCLQRTSDNVVAEAWDRRRIFWHELKGKQHLCVTSRIAANSLLWSNSIDGQNIAVPSGRKMGMTLKLLTDPQFKTQEGGYQVAAGVRAWPIDLGLLRKWATESGCPQDEIERLLTPPSEGVA